MVLADRRRANGGRTESDPQSLRKFRVCVNHKFSTRARPLPERSCGLSGSFNDTFTITKIDATTYNIDTGVGGESTSGSVDGCKVSAATTGSGTDTNGNPYTYSVSRNYTLHGTSVSGSGSASVTSAPACTQQFTTASGVKN